MSGQETPERPVEARLRRALAARAQTVTVRDLRPADPPGPHLRRTRLPGLRLHALPARRLALPLAALTTVAAVAIGYVALAPGGAPSRPLPASTPGPVSPPPAPRPSGVDSPRPEPSRPPTAKPAEKGRAVEPSVPTPGTPKSGNGTRSSAPQDPIPPSAKPSRTPSAPAVR
ncbi:MULTISPECIES: hypothetical protein [unclassified Streptomyces]|uniref:Uncharacterized protein n=1 Tax=Streptomyces sp. NBC_00060 TaxID=2975636 RepID=A0AAU2GSY6_9ACTN